MRTETSYGVKKVRMIRLVKMLFVSLLGLTSISYFSTPTNSLFTDTEELTMNVAAGWEAGIPPDDGGEDEPPIIDEEQVIFSLYDENGSCKEIHVSVKLDEKSAPLTESLVYEVYQTRNLAQEQKELIAGPIEIDAWLNPGDTTGLSHQLSDAQRCGSYWFKVWVKSQPQAAQMSGAIVVQCENCHDEDQGNQGGSGGDGGNSGGDHQNGNGDEQGNPDTGQNDSGGDSGNQNGNQGGNENGHGNPDSSRGGPKGG